ncbi:MAG TPA: alpha/beta fold hydrolase [Candidatus Acidoferrales bacterium]|nr:alpha/beta fold hydrolase [Candidatus Acidoferrales bacterium]
MIGEPLEMVESVTREPDTSATIDALTPIWQSVLERSSIRPEDNFFDLGGDPPLAYKLFDEIAKVCGRELPPVTIYRAPTITGLAALLDQPATPVLPPLVLLKAGGEQPPIFIAHGLGSSAMEFFDLVRYIRTSRPIYGLQAKGSDGAAPPFARIEDMAQFHLDAIQSVQPHGPYSLIGYSLGGVVAFEIARRISASGEKVAFLAMIDSYPHTEPLTLWKRIHLIAAQLRYRASDLMRSAAYRPVPVPLSRVRARARFSDFLAWTRYRPRFYDGKITFARAESSQYPDPVTTWSHLASAFEGETLPGDHHGILIANSKSLALVLTRHLKNELRRQ